MMLKEVEGLRHKEFGRTLPIETLSWPGVELPSDGIKIGLTEAGKVGALGQILTEQSVGVLVDAALPRAVRISEVDLDAGDLGKPLVLRHFASLIASHGKPALRIDAHEDGAEAGHDRLGGRVVHLSQCHEQRGSFDQRSYCGGVACAFDQVAFPVSSDDVIIDFRGPQMNASHVGNSAPAVFASGARTAALERLSQAGDQLGPQFAARHSVKRRVDCFVADLEGRIVRVHPSQYARYLLRRTSLAQQAFDMAPQRTVLRQARRASCRPRQFIGALLRERCTVASRHRRPAPFLRRSRRIARAIAFQFTTDRARRTPHGAQDSTGSSQLRCL